MSKHLVRKYLVPMNLQLFAEEASVEAGVEDVPAAGEQTEGSADQTGVETQAAAEPEKQNNFEKAFAKRLAQEREKWESERKAELEKYKDYDALRRAAEYLQRTSGITDMETLMREIELAELQEQAQRQNLTVEEYQRMKELEELKAWKQQMEQELQRREWERTYWDNLKDFSKDHGVEPEKLNQFMVENGFSINPDDMKKSFEIALKAYKYDDLVKQLENAKKEGMKELIQAKSNIPTVATSGVKGEVKQTAPKTFAEARARAMQRFAE